MSYNSYKYILLHWFYQFPEVFGFPVVMFFADEANLTYIPLSSFIVLLIILLTCASRRRKQTPFSPIENPVKDDIKTEYAVMCFPCLKKKPEHYELTTDLADQFEYIVEKYTIRKVPLLLANTVEDVIERSEELKMAKVENNQNKPLEKDDFVNFQVDQEIYNDQKLAPCFTVAANTVCPAKKICKDRPKPSDILESMSPITRSPTRHHNYVIIPTKGSLRNKDIMMTKREITNQYLNNFSSIFVDNLKDQVPKDPENFPNLSRPYTSAFKTFPIPQNGNDRLSVSYNYDQNHVNNSNINNSKKAKKGKYQRVAYAYPAEHPDGNDDVSNVEELSYDSNSVQDQTDVTESEFQEEKESLPSRKTVKEVKKVPNPPAFENNPFRNPLPKPPVKPMPQIDSGTAGESSYEYTNQKERHRGPKNVTYEDIQALDVGYEFSSCEKLGVKPKMTRIHYPHETTDKLVETIRQLALSETAKLSKKNFAQDYAPSTKATKTTIVDKPSRFKNKTPATSPRSFTPVLPTHGRFFTPQMEKSSSKDMMSESCFMAKVEMSSPEESAEPQTDSALRDQTSTLTFTSKSVDGSKSQSINDVRELEQNEKDLDESVTDISKLYDLTIPMNKTFEGYEPDVNDTRYPVSSKSRSFQEAARAAGRKEIASGNSQAYSSDKRCKRVPESETETSCSLYSHESKTSTGMTSVRSTELEENKRATLRWTIIIKHHKQNDPSKKVIKNIRADG